MPIKQERVIAIIHAGQDFQQALLKLTDIIITAARAAHHNEQTAQEALDTISLAAQPVLLLEDAMKSGGVLQAEAKYYKSNERRNISAAKWQAKRRDDLKHGNAPTSKPRAAASTSKPLLTEEQKSALDREAEELFK